MRLSPLRLAMTAPAWTCLGQHIAPGYLKGLYCLMLEIPEGSWGAWGHTVSAMEIAAVAGTDKNMGRFKELQQNTAKLKAARVS